MTIDEAIKIKTSVIRGSVVYSSQKIRQAEKLGSEALKRIKARREGEYAPDLKLLPGETEE